MDRKTTKPIRQSILPHMQELYKVMKKGCTNSSHADSWLVVLQTPRVRVLQLKSTLLESTSPLLVRELPCRRMHMLSLTPPSPFLGLVIIARNYLEVYPYDKWSDSIVPDFAEGERFIPAVCEMKEGQTSRPNLLTEADLVGLMDKNGIGEYFVTFSFAFSLFDLGCVFQGTDATIAEHIAKIIEREYVVEKQDGRVKYLVPSTLGIGLVDGYNEIGFDRSLTKPHLRREVSSRPLLANAFLLNA